MAPQQPAAKLPAVAAKRPVVRRVRPAPPAEPVRETATETVTEFFPLMDVAPPFGRGELVRVRLPAAAMRTVGLPVAEDRLLEPIQADVLVGQEGLARAIRFVRVE
jgi:hypothetical protein